MPDTTPLLAAVLCVTPFALARQAPPAPPVPAPASAPAPAEPVPTSQPATRESVRPRPDGAAPRDPAHGVDEGDPRIDETTGRAVQTFRKDRAFDFLNQRVELDIPDLNTPALAGSTTLSATPIAYARTEMTLDSVGPLVTGVRVDGVPARFVPGEKTLRIDLGKRVMPGQTTTVTIDYTLDFADAKGEGLTWCAPRDGADSPSSQVPMIHAQGEAELNSRWFPCFDSPEERLTSEVIVTCDSTYQVVSNGTLIEQAAASADANGAARTRWHWRQSQPHAPYLITVGIGQWSIVEVGGDARPRLSMPVYALRGQEENASTVFASTPEILAFFEEKFQEPFPWDKYAQVLVRCFSAGGMENTSATFLASRVGGATEANSRDDLIAHEMAHQWFGDLVTCKGWEHIWLNEAWASYAEALWAEEHARRGAVEEGKDPDAAARAEYLRQIGQTMRSVTRRAPAEAPEKPALVSRRFINPDAVFEKRDNPYSKGVVLLHMLRERMGDEAFFRATALYLDRHRFGAVETDDFRAVFEEVSGLSLERFFEQWAYRPGLARVGVTPTVSGSDIVIRLEQTQRIDRHNPAYLLSLPIVVTTPEGTREVTTVTFDSREATTTVHVPDGAMRVDVDPAFTMLAHVTPRAFDPRTGEAIAEPTPTRERSQRPPAPPVEGEPR